MPWCHNRTLPPLSCTTERCCAAGAAAAPESASRRGSTAAVMAARPASTTCLPSTPASSTYTLRQAGRQAGRWAERGVATGWGVVCCRAESGAWQGQVTAQHRHRWAASRIKASREAMPPHSKATLNTSADTHLNRRTLPSWQPAASMGACSVAAAFNSPASAAELLLLLPGRPVPVSPAAGFAPAFWQRQQQRPCRSDGRRAAQRSRRLA